MDLCRRSQRRTWHPPPPRTPERPMQTSRQEPAWESLIEFRETESLKEVAPHVVTKSRMERPR